MTHTPIQKYRFFSLVWNFIYIFYAIVHIPILALSLHFAPLIHLNSQLIENFPIIIAFPLTNVAIILVLCALCVVGLIFSTKIRCCMCRIASIVILCIHASLNIILILIRGAIIGFCIFSIHHLAKSAQELPTDSPTELTTEPSVTDSYTCQLVSIIIALFLMILSSITEIIQVIFSSLVLHQICIEDRKQRCCRIQMKGDYLKMDTTGEAL